MKKLILISNDYLKFNNNSVSADYNDTINIIQAISKIIFFIFYVGKKIKKVFLKLL